MKIIIIFAAMAVSIANGVYAAAPAISKTEARHLPAQAIAHRVTDQLADLLQPTDPITPVSPVGGNLDNMSFWTKARSAGTAGLCVSTHTVFYFTPDNPDDFNTKARVRVSDVYTIHTYRAATPPAEPFPQALTGKALIEAQTTCQDFHPERGDNGFDMAGDAFVPRALWILNHTLNDARGSAGAVIDECPDADDPKTCGAELGSFTSKI